MRSHVEANGKRTRAERDDDRHTFALYPETFGTRSTRVRSFETRSTRVHLPCARSERVCLPFLRSARVRLPFASTSDIESKIYETNGFIYNYKFMND